MRKYIIALMFLLAFQSILKAQSLLDKIRLEKRHRDSLRIEVLEQRLQMAKDTARINCLNEIAMAFLDAQMNMQKKTDSGFFYSDLANHEAFRAGYKYGEAQALMTIANAKWPFNEGRKECEVNAKRALTLATELNDNLLIGKSYLQLGLLENPVENYQNAVNHLKKTGNVKLETEATIRLCMAENENGQYETGFSYCEKCIELASLNVKKDTSDEWAHEMVAWSYMNMYDLYYAAGDNETALEYLKKANKYAEERNLSGWQTYGEISELYCLMDNQDSALFYWNRWKKDWNNYVEGYRIYGNNILARIYMKKNQPDSALFVLNNSLSVYRNKSKQYFYNYGDRSLLNTSLLQAEAYLQKKDYDSAFLSAQTAVEGWKHHNNRPRMMDGYKLLSSVYFHLGRFKEAYETLVKYQTIRDSIQSRQFLIRLNNYKQAAQNAKNEAHIGFLNRDNKIKEQQLKQELLLRNFLIGGLIVLLITGIFIYRTITLKRKTERLQHGQLKNRLKVHQLESEKRQAELQQQATELEMQALRAQMNPHFIFNCLSSINRFILKNESKEASSYLTRFSRLIRMVLINSQRTLIRLEDELQMLRLYLEMEQLRFKHVFDYSITFLNAIEADNIFVPPLLLQPFCENAIWHGLMHKGGNGKLEIELSIKDDVLYCTITDNGVGREQAEEMKSRSTEKDKSMGLKITSERLSLLNRKRGVDTFFEIKDLTDERGKPLGTRVNLTISYKESVEESV